MEVAARLAVLVACGVAGGALLVLAATPERAADDPGSTPPPMGGLPPAVLGAFVLLAGGTALTGAGTLPAAAGSPIVAGAGIGLLAVAGAVTGRAALRLARAPGSRRAVGASPVLLVMAWAGAALALGSWLLAVGTVAVAVLAGVRLERRVP